MQIIDGVFSTILQNPDNWYFEKTTTISYVATDFYKKTTIFAIQCNFFNIYPSSN